MNERIQKLSNQAYDDLVNQTGNIVVFDEDFQQRFAELIVKECIEHLEGTVLVPNIEHSRTKTKCIRSIKEHFGVEL